MAQPGYLPDKARWDAVSYENKLLFIFNRKLSQKVFFITERN